MMVGFAAQWAWALESVCRCGHKGRLDLDRLAPAMSLLHVQQLLRCTSCNQRAARLRLANTWPPTQWKA